MESCQLIKRLRDKKKNKLFRVACKCIAPNFDRAVQHSTSPCNTVQYSTMHCYHHSQCTNTRMTWRMCSWRIWWLLIWFWRNPLNSLRYSQKLSRTDREQIATRCFDGKHFNIISIYARIFQLVPAFKFFLLKFCIRFGTIRLLLLPDFMTIILFVKNFNS
jgi:hypothetical protein